MTFIVAYAIIFSVDGLNGRRAPVAQSAERRLGKAEVSSSSLPGSLLIWRVSEDEARFLLLLFFSSIRPNRCLLYTSILSISCVVYNFFQLYLLQSAGVYSKLYCIVESQKLERAVSGFVKI